MVFSLLLPLVISTLGVTQCTDGWGSYSNCSCSEADQILDVELPVLVDDVDKQPQLVTTMRNMSQGKWTLVVNVASFCRLTLQYWDLNEVYSKAKGQLQIVGNPCNQFGLQVILVLISW